MLPQKLTNTLTVLISLVWTANVIAGFINPGLRDPMINALFAVVVGSIYALGRRTDGSNPVDDARRRLGDLIAGKQPGTAEGEPPQRTSTGPGGDQQ